jgi:hypothetical protein
MLVQLSTGVINFPLLDAVTSNFDSTRGDFRFSPHGSLSCRFLRFHVCFLFRQQSS